MQTVCRILRQSKALQVPRPCNAKRAPTVGLYTPENEGERTSMSVWDKIKGEFIDIVQWTDDSQNTMVYRFERYGNQIKNRAQLTVREGQVAVFVNEGQIADV